MKLTDTKCKNAKPGEHPDKPDKDYTNKSYKLSDGYGMYLHVKLNGGKYWKLRQKKIVQNRAKQNR